MHAAPIGLFSIRRSTRTAPRCRRARAEIGVPRIPAGETRFRPRPAPSQPLAAAARGLEKKPHELSVD